ncbi:hypothetical protein AAE478_007385 [Parahypoxylon ruwenzoriense]
MAPKSGKATASKGTKPPATASKPAPKKKGASSTQKEAAPKRSSRKVLEAADEEQANYGRAIDRANRERQSRQATKRQEEDSEDEEDGNLSDGPVAAGKDEAKTERTHGRQRHSGRSSKPTKASRPNTTAQPRGSKRKRDEDLAHDEEEEESDQPRAKKSRSAQPAPKAAPKTAPKAVPKAVSKAAPKAARKAALPRGVGRRGVPFNEVPTKQLDIFVFGEGSSGELGLGSAKYDGKRPIDVKRPRINHNLEGIVNIACGGMHAIALTNDQRVLTWGVNDDKALGRDTFWEGGVRDIGEEEDEDSDDTGINPQECTPGQVNLDILPKGTNICQVVATDSASFILTDDGWVYGWGTFRGSDGIIGFSETVRIQPTPTIVPELKNICKLACGSNHVLALDLDGKVFTWGSGGQYQLGRKPLSRLGGPSAGLRPQCCGKFTKRHRAVRVGAGSYHSFYIDNNDKVWAWGLNNYAQTGLNDDSGEDDAMVLQPRVVGSLGDRKIRQVVGGEHHSVACTVDGQLLTWGRVDGHQVGQKPEVFTEENAVFDDNNKPRILLQPTVIDGIKATFVAAGTDTSFALDEKGKVYSWGFSANYQTGQGTTDDIEAPTMIDNSAIRDRNIVWAGAGGQYSIVAAENNDDLTNGH